MAVCQICATSVPPDQIYCSDSCIERGEAARRLRERHGEDIGASLFMGILAALVATGISAIFLYSVVLKVVIGICVGAAAAAARHMYKRTHPP